MASIELHPTGLVQTALAAGVLEFMSRAKPGLRGLAASADVVAADCRFNDWIVSDVKKSGMSDEGWLRLLERAETAEERCHAAMAAFAAGGSQEVLCNELTAVADSLNSRSL